MSTVNLGLEEIVLEDTLNGTMLEKTNNNMQKIDAKYGELKNALLQQTGKQTLTEAIDFVGDISNENSQLKQIGNATASQILKGKTALVQGQTITGVIQNQEAQTIIPGTVNKAIPAGKYLSGVQLVKGDLNLIPENIVSGKAIFGVSGKAKKQPTINVTLTGTYASSIGGYGAGIDQNGTLVIWAMSNAINYEHINFVDTAIGSGTIGHGWNITEYDTSDPINVPHACTITGLQNHNNINISLDVSSRSSGYDYLTANVSITVS